MTWKLFSAVALGAALLAGGPAHAVSCKRDADCSAGQVCSAGTCTSKRSAAARAADAVAPTSEATAGTKRTPYFGWGGLGLYNVPGNTYFGVHAGGAANLIQLTPEMPLVGWGDLAITFGSDLLFPLAVGAGVRYDAAGPFQLLGGLGFAILPHTGGGTTPVGLRIMGTALYPLPQLNPNLSAQAQLSYDFLTESSHLFTFTVGVGYAL
jgi:Cys-rich repeat protein